MQVSVVQVSVVQVSVVQVSVLQVSVLQVSDSGEHVSGGGHWGVCGPGCPQEIACHEGWTRLASGCYLLDNQVKEQVQEQEQNQE